MIDISIGDYKHWRAGLSIAERVGCWWTLLKNSARWVQASGAKPECLAFDHVAAEAATYKATGKSEERFLGCASRLLHGSGGEKKRRLAPLGMTTGCFVMEKRGRKRRAIEGQMIGQARAGSPYGKPGSNWHTIDGGIRCR